MYFFSVLACLCETTTKTRMLWQHAVCMDCCLEVYGMLVNSSVVVDVALHRAALCLHEHSTGIGTPPHPHGDGAAAALLYAGVLLLVQRAGVAAGRGGIRHPGYTPAIALEA